MATGPLSIVVHGGNSDTAATQLVERFANRWSRGLGWDLEFVDDSPALMSCRLDHTLGDRYRITTTLDCIEMVAGTLESLQWALYTCEQMFPPEIFDDEFIGDIYEFMIPSLDIEDFPQFRWRGVHLDVARHFYDVAQVARFVDLLAMHKFNILHLHLSDDQGWRLEIPAWPKLTSVGSKRSSSPQGHESGGVDDGVVHQGYFSADDIASLVAYAQERFITIVPEIDMPGHVQAALSAYPKLSNTKDHLTVATRWGISRHIFNVDESTFSFAEDIVRYLTHIFPGPYVHIGGDECPVDEWENSDRVTARMSDLNVSRVAELQSVFTTRLHNVVVSSALADRGPLHETARRTLAWDEVLDGEAPRDLIIVAWRHSSEGARAARLGHDVVMAPMQFTYFDWPQSTNPDEPVALMQPPYPTSLEKVYKFKVIPPGLEDEFVPRILGAQAQHWTEYIGTVAHLEYMAFPRLCAFSEVVWGSAGEFDEFHARLTRHVIRLAALGVNFRRLDR